MKILFILDYDSFQSDYLDVAEAVSGHVSMIWFRVKGLSEEQLYEKASALKKAVPDTKLILSSNASIAFELNFAGVQLGINTETPDEVRERYPDLIIGYSAHSIEEANSVDADYVTLSPIFYTEKPYKINPLGVLDVTSVNKPVYALGGVNVDNVDMLSGCGFAGIAGITLWKNVEVLSLKEI